MSTWPTRWPASRWRGCSAARRIADVGAGAGFPGLPLAAALPDARVDLIESTGRKCDFIRQAIERAGIANAQVVCERSEIWAAELRRRGGREAYDAVTARAVGRLSTLAELASPLLVAGGVLVAWKGRRDPDEEAELERAAAAWRWSRWRSDGWARMRAPVTGTCT